jgi:NAD(P) transhydrogenase
VILIATGSSPVRPVIFPFDTSGVNDSDTILESGRLPKVIGVGVIGSEYASTFGPRDTQTTFPMSGSVPANRLPA